MTRELSISILASLAISITCILLSRDWIIAVYQNDPLSAACYTIAAIAVGVLLATLLFKAKVDEAVKKAEAGAQARYDAIMEETRMRVRADIKREDREREEAKAKAENEETDRRNAEIRTKALIQRFNHADPNAKHLMVEMYDNGSIEMDYDTFRMYGLSEWADYMTAFGDYRTIIKVFLLDKTRKMLDGNPHMIGRD